MESQWCLANFTVPAECACACAFGPNQSVIGSYEGIDMSQVMRRPSFYIYVKIKALISCTVTVQLISAFIFVT